MAAPIRPTTRSSIPVIDDDGVHRFTVLAKGHQADCGNALPTTYMGAAKDVYAEGALIFPAVKIQDDYEHVMDIVRMCRMRMRVPDQWWGDYLATLGAARVGEREILALGREVGWDLLAAYTKEWFDYSEQRMIDDRSAPCRRARSPGRARTTPFPARPTDGVTIKVTVEVKPEEAMIEVDLRDNPDSMENGLNLSEGCALSAPMVGDLQLDRPDRAEERGQFPADQGASSRRLHRRPADPPDLVLGRHHQHCRSRRQSGAGGDRRTRRRARHGGDGRRDPSSDRRRLRRPRRRALCQRGLSRLHRRRRHAAQRRLADHPSRRQCRHVLPGLDRDRRAAPSDLRAPAPAPCPTRKAPGRFRGAVAAYAEFSPVGCDMTVAYVSDGNFNPAKGTRGGGLGAPSSQFRRRADGSLEPVGNCAEVVIRPDEAMVSYSCGGGGYGPPHERSVERVAHDVSEGWVSRERAEAVYAVAIGPRGIDRGAHRGAAPGSRLRLDVIPESRSLHKIPWRAKTVASGSPAANSARTVFSSSAFASASSTALSQSAPGMTTTPSTSPKIQSPGAIGSASTFDRHVDRLHLAATFAVERADRRRRKPESASRG